MLILSWKHEKDLDEFVNEFQFFLDFLYFSMQSLFNCFYILINIVFIFFLLENKSHHTDVQLYLVTKLGFVLSCVSVQNFRFVVLICEFGLTPSSHVISTREKDKLRWLTLHVY